MATSVADPQQNIIAAEPSERKTSVRVTEPWEYDERRLESGANFENSQPVFPLSGSKLNEFRPREEIRSFDSNLDLVRDMFMKPLENVTNIAGKIVDELPGAGLDLLKEITTSASEVKPKDPEEVKNEGNETFRKENYIAALKKMPEHRVSAVEVGSQIMSTDEACIRYGINPDASNTIIDPKTGELRIDVEIAVADTITEDTRKAAKGNALSSALATGNKGVVAGSVDQNLAPEGAGLLSVASGNAGG